MFEDIYIVKKKKINYKNYINCEFCTVCGSKNVKEIRSYFSSKTRFKFEMECKDCGNQWNYSIDKDFEVREIDGKKIK